MAVPPLAVLAAVASLDWPVWEGAWLLLLFGAFWFSQPVDERATDDHEAGGGGAQGGSRAEDAARIRELQDTVDELTRCASPRSRRRSAATSS